MEGLGDAPNGSSGGPEGARWQGDGAQIADYVEEKKLLKAEMDVRQAVSWILSYAVRPDLLKAKESK